MKNNKQMWMKRVQHVDMTTSTYKSITSAEASSEFQIKIRTTLRGIHTKYK